MVSKDPRKNKNHTKGIFNTISPKVDHDISLAGHDAREFKRCNITPDFKSAEECIINCLLIHVWSVAQDPKKKKGTVIRPPYL